MSAHAAGDVLEVRDIAVSFAGVRALDKVSFSISGPGVFGLIGSNGAGKTTLLNVVTAAIPPATGSVFMRGQSVGGVPTYQIARLGVARTFQNVRLFGDQSVLENVAIGTYRNTHAGLLAGMFALPRARAEQRRASEEALEALAFVGLEDRANDAAELLPFGQQRLLELARALALRPWLLLLDEPAAGLNDAETERLADLIVSLPARGLTVLVVEHNMALMMRISQSIVVLDHGEKIAEGSPSEIQADRTVIDAYLGEDVMP
jgi:ABC-type branched-subunit amino acid transport system ATPase component